MQIPHYFYTQSFNLINIKNRECLQKLFLISWLEKVLKILNIFLEKTDDELFVRPSVHPSVQGILPDSYLIGSIYVIQKSIITYLGTWMLFYEVFMIILAMLSFLQSNYCKRTISGGYNIWRKLVFEQVGVDLK